MNICYFRNLNGADNEKIKDYRTMVEKISVRMEELERKAANGSCNIGGALNQVANVFRHERQDTRMASGTEERATLEARTPMGRLNNNSNSLESANEAEALSNNSNNQGQPDVNMGRQPNVDNQIHELDQTPLVFGGEDINMSLQPMNNNNPHEQAQALEVNMSRQAMDAGRPEDVRLRKQGKRILDEDEEDFSFDEEDFGVDDEERDEDRGVGPRLVMDPQKSTENLVPNISNRTPSTLQSLSITSDHVAEIAKIVIAVQNENAPKPSRSSKSNVSNGPGTIKGQIRREKSPRKAVLVVRVQFSSQDKGD